MDNTEEPVIQKHKRGRPAKPGRRIFVGIFLREGEDDKTIKRLAELPEGKRSAYIRRVLSGAPVEVHDSALAVESETVRAGLDAMAGAWEEE